MSKMTTSPKVHKEPSLGSIRGLNQESTIGIWYFHFSKERSSYKMHIVVVSWAKLAQLEVGLSFSIRYREEDFSKAFLPHIFHSLRKSVSLAQTYSLLLQNYKPNQCTKQMASPSLKAHAKSVKGLMLSWVVYEYCASKQLSHGLEIGDTTISIMMWSVHLKTVQISPRSRCSGISHYCCSHVFGFGSPVIPDTTSWSSLSLSLCK